jgi:hypothetical protein
MSTDMRELRQRKREVFALIDALDREIVILSPRVRRGDRAALARLKEIEKACAAAIREIQQFKGNEQRIEQQRDAAGMFRHVHRKPGN